MTAPSLLNPKITLTTVKWGVTLTQDIGNFHARLVFEGVRKEGYFYQIAHLTGPSRSNTLQGCSNGSKICSLRRSAKGVVEIEKEKSADTFKAKYSKKTPTWLVSRYKIESLIEEIEAEVGKESPFNICGSKSIFSKPAEVIEIHHPLLAEIKKHDQHLFLRLYDSAQNRGECTGMSREEFDKAISEIKKKIDAPDLNYPKLIELTSAFTKTFNMYQNNCFTWCRGNLEKLGIPLTDTMLEQVISVTALYVTYKPQENISDDLSLVVSENLNKDEEKVPLNLCERFVTYDLCRDKRTEEWKVIDNIHIQQKTIYTISGIVIASMFVIPSFVIASLNTQMRFVTIVSSSFTAGSLSYFCVAMQEKNNILINGVRLQNKFDMSGNNLQNVKPIGPLGNTLTSLWERMANAYGQIREKGIYATIANTFFFNKKVNH